jgi:hypothetical protein
MIEFKTIRPTTNMDMCCLWYFFHSTPTGELSYDGDNTNIYCNCLNFCPGNLELKFEKCLCKEDKICLLLCLSLYFI